SAGDEDQEAPGTWPIEAWVTDITRRGLSNVEERARAVDILEMRELRTGRFARFVEAINAAAHDASSEQGLAELRYDALDRLARYDAPTQHLTSILRPSLTAYTGDAEQTSRILRLLANHSDLIAPVLLTLLPTPMRREELLIVLCAELVRSELTAPLRYAEHIDRIEQLTSALEPAAWIRERLETALSLCMHDHQRETILRGIRGCLRSSDDHDLRAQITARLVQVLADSGDRERALDECRKALRDSSPGSELERLYLELAGADPFVLEGLMEPSEHHTSMLPHSSLAALLLRASRAVHERHSDPSNALTLVERAYSLQPGDPEIAAVLIAQAFDLGEHLRAAETAREVARTRGDIDDRLVLGAISEALTMGPSS
ncbi:MAG: hypothetical protein ACPHRO_14550, partial [Nannocystaceae bacterium]